MVALSFVKNDDAVLAISNLDQLESGERYGEFPIKESKENVVIVVISLQPHLSQYSSAQLYLLYWPDMRIVPLGSRGEFGS
jgi:hypothetical protein